MSTGAITIDQARSTMMARAEPAGVMEQEQGYLAALAAAATFGIRSNVLEMRTAGDAIAVMMQLAP